MFACDINELMNNIDKQGDSNIGRITNTVYHQSLICTWSGCPSLCDSLDSLPSYRDVSQQTCPCHRGVQMSQSDSTHTHPPVPCSSTTETKQILLELWVKSKVTSVPHYSLSAMNYLRWNLLDRDSPPSYTFSDCIQQHLLSRSGADKTYR